MSDFSNEFENRVATWVFRPATSVTRPSQLWMALYTAVIDAEAGTGTEVSGGGYQRVQVTSAFGAASGGQIINTGSIVFPSPSANWGTITHVAIRDASTGGNAVTVLKALVDPVVINAGDAPPGFNPGDITIAIT
jgi:hypothetical protein